MTTREYATAAALHAKAASLSELAGHFDGRAHFFVDDVAAADTFVEHARANWVGPRADHDLLIVCAYVDTIRPMAESIGDLAAKLQAFADDADELAGYLAGHEATLAGARAETPPGDTLPHEAWLAQRGIEQLSLDWIGACARHARVITAASAPLETAYRAFASGFSAPVVTGGAFFAALVGLAAAAGIDLELLGYDDAKVRARLERGLGDLEGQELVVAVMSTASNAEAVAYWNTLTDRERAALIRSRPDLVAKMLDGGGTLTEGDLRKLDGSNAYPQFSEAFTAAWELSAGLRVATIEIGEEFTVVAMMMSDGTVQVAVARGVHAGIGVEAANGQSEAEASLGLFTMAEQVFVFPSEQAAQGALDELEHEVLSLGAERKVLDILELFMPDDVNLMNDFEAAIAELWDEYGMVASYEGGIYADVELEIKDAVAEADLDGAVRVALYDTDTTELANEPARSGILVAGAVGVHGEPGQGAGPAAGAEGAFTIDAYTDDNGDEFVTITVQGSTSGGVVGEIVHNSGIEWDAQAERGVEATVTITVPGGELVGDIGGLVTSLTRGELPEAVRDLYDDAKIEISVNTSTAVNNNVEIDVATVELNVEHTRTETENAVTLRKYPNGEFYSQTHVAEMIDEQLGIEPDDRPVAEPEIAVISAPSLEFLVASHGADAVIFNADGEPVGVNTDGELIAAYPAVEATAAEPANEPSWFIEQIAQPATPTDGSAPPIEAPAPPGPDAVLYDADGIPVGVDTGEGFRALESGELFYEGDGHVVAVAAGEGFIRFDADGDATSVAIGGRVVDAETLPPGPPAPAIVDPLDVSSVFLDPSAVASPFSDRWDFSDPLLYHWDGELNAVHTRTGAFLVEEPTDFGETGVDLVYDIDGKLVAALRGGRSTPSSVAPTCGSSTATTGSRSRSTPAHPWCRYPRLAAQTRDRVHGHGPIQVAPSGRRVRSRGCRVGDGLFGRRRRWERGG